MKNNTFVYVLKIFVPLLLICAVVAGVISGISVLTKKRIAENEAMVEQQKEDKKLSAIAEIYGDGHEFVKVVDQLPEDIDELRFARDEDGKLLATVTLTVKGYSDGLQVFVAFADGEVRRVMVLASNETTGIGSKVSDEEYLSGYEGQKGSIAFGNGVDKIAGASISSKAVLGAVNRASEFVGSISIIGKEAN